MKHKEQVGTQLAEQDFKLKKVEIFETMLESFQNQLKAFDDRF